MSRRRFLAAMYAQDGACNPVALARALVAAIDECRAEDMDHAAIAADPAVGLITHQLNHVLNVNRYERGDAYEKDMAACRERAQ